MCHVSSCYTRDGQLKKKYTSWETEATLLSIWKVEWGHGVTGISKSEQPLYEALPGIHGSNGTYAGYTITSWTLYYRVKRHANEWFESNVLFEDISNYMVHELKTRLGWKKISPQRLERLNRCINGKKLTVITHEMDKDYIDRSFTPKDNNNWNDFLNDCFQELI